MLLKQPKLFVNVLAMMFQLLFIGIRLEFNRGRSTSSRSECFISKPLFKSHLVYLFNQIAEKDKSKELLDVDSIANVKLDGKRIILVKNNELNLEIAE